MPINKLGNNTIPKRILEWLKNRGISDEVIAKSNIQYSSYHGIIIPVYDKNGSFLFNKYRRDPDKDDEENTPKYKYDKGSSPSLYNIQKNLGKTVYITEGEFDALALESHGLCAVSSTGGSGSFLKEWVALLKDKTVFIVYDRDEAGYKGMTHVQSLIPHAEIIILPPFNGKDVTDYLIQHSLKEFFSIELQQFNIPEELESMPESKKELNKVVTQYKNAANEILEVKRQYLNDRKDVSHILWIGDYLNKRYEQYNNMTKRTRYKKTSKSDVRLQDAKERLITDFIPFNPAGYANCIWHKEKTSSMFYNKPGTKFSNTVKCFGCGAMGDTIDVIMQMYKLNTKEAIDFILNED